MSKRFAKSIWLLQKTLFSGDGEVTK